jgi:hypothetical protein
MMATKIYDTGKITLLDDREIELKPLKIIYLRQFMDLFEFVKSAKNDDDAIMYLTHCALVAMKEFAPDIKTLEQFEDLVDLPTVYKILDLAAGIRISEKSKKEVKEQATESESGSTWEDLDLAKLESEVFLLGVWKSYDELEHSLSMPELLASLGSRRELDYEEKKFLAAIQGVDLDKQSGKQDSWEEMKARVFSKGQASGSNDVLALQGANASKQGFGIGMGLGYTNVTASGEQPFGKKK